MSIHAIARISRILAIATAVFAQMGNSEPN
jgi:hypothetical protein